MHMVQASPKPESVKSRSECEQTQFKKNKTMRKTEEQSYMYCSVLMHPVAKDDFRKNFLGHVLQWEIALAEVTTDVLCIILHSNT